MRRTEPLTQSELDEYFREHGDRLESCTADYWAPPVYDGVYHVSLSLDSAHSNPRTAGMHSKSGQGYDGVHVEAEIIRAVEQHSPGQFEGWKLQFFVNTLSFGRRPSSLTRLLQAVNKGHLRRNAGTLVEFLSRMRPELLVTVVWKAYSHEERRDVLTGMKSFPTDDDGKILHEFCRDGECLQAKAKVVDYRPVPIHWLLTNK